MQISRTVTKYVATLVALALALCCLTAFAACTDEDVFAEGATMTLVIEEDPVREIVVDLSGMSKDCDLIDVLDAAGVSYDLEGTMLYSVGSLAPQAPVYIYLYTSVEADFDTSAYATTIDYDGKTLGNSGVGALDMSIEDGCTVYIGTITY